MKFRRAAAILILLPGIAGCDRGQQGRTGNGPADGAVVYHVCAGCHGMTGRGVAGKVAPDLVGSSLVLAEDPDPLIRLLLHGIENDGQWPGVMLPWKESLDDQQIAAVLTYIRSQWGNDAEPVTPSQVSKIRKLTADRDSPYPREELSP